MGSINVLIGIILNVLGVLLISYYLSLVKKKQDSDLTVNLLGAGIIFIMIGLYYIFKK